MTRRALFIVPCEFCGKKHPYFGENVCMCSCGAMMVIKPDLRNGVVIVKPVSPGETKRYIEQDAREKHDQDDRHGLA